MTVLKYSVLGAILLTIICVVSITAKENSSSKLIAKEVSNSSDTLTTSVEKSLTIEQQWMNFESKIKNIASQAVKFILPKLIGATNSLNISSTCTREVMLWMGGIKNIKTWALRIFDASAKMFEGILTGAVSSFGDYDECINTMVYNERPGKNHGKLLFQGKYCTVDAKPPLPPKRDFYKLDEVLDELKNFSKRGTGIGEASKYAQFFYFMSLRFGICLPSGCTLEDVDQIAKIIAKEVGVNAVASRCEIKTENEFSPLMISIISMFSFLGLMMLIGSLIDIHSYYRKRVYKHKVIRMFLAFSLMSNFQKFVNTETSSDTFSCLNGVRFLSMSWIILGHTYLIINFQLFRGLESAKAYARDFAFQAIVNASVAVDTFFFMGGLLVCYFTMKLVKEQKNKLNVKIYILHRIWRIVPVYAFVIAFMFLSDLLGSGPIWHDMSNHYVESCYKNWWTNFLFINNFYHADDMCIPQSWYVASDMQLYIAALLMLIPLIRWPKVGISVAVGGIILSIIYSGTGTYLYNYPPAMLFAHPDPEQRINYWATFYFKPFVHAGPYCIGLLAGYLLFMKPDLKIPKKIQVIGWCCAFICSFSVLYGVWEWNKGRDPTMLESIFYSSFNRVAWTLGVAWMIVCCATGHGGVINYILSWKAFVPLGRLTYVAFLIHPIVQVAAVGSVRYGLQTNHYFAVWVYFGHLCVTYGSAFAGSMLVESPFLALEKILIHKAQKSRENSSKNMEHMNNNLKLAQNGDIPTVVPITESVCNGEVAGLDNKAFVYKL